jgi:hypothetical protein
MGNFLSRIFAPLFITLNYSLNLCCSLRFWWVLLGESSSSNVRLMRCLTPLNWLHARKNRTKLQLHIEECLQPSSIYKRTTIISNSISELSHYHVSWLSFYITTELWMKIASAHRLMHVGNKKCFWETVNECPPSTENTGGLSWIFFRSFTKRIYCIHILYICLYTEFIRVIYRNMHMLAVLEWTICLVGIILNVVVFWKYKTTRFASITILFWQLIYIARYLLIFSRKFRHSSIFGTSMQLLLFMSVADTISLLSLAFALSTKYVFRNEQDPRILSIICKVASLKWNNFRFLVLILHFFLS